MLFFLTKWAFYCINSMMKLDMARLLRVFLRDTSANPFSYFEGEEKSSPFLFVLFSIHTFSAFTYCSFNNIRAPLCEWPFPAYSVFFIVQNLHSPHKRYAAYPCHNSVSQRFPWALIHSVPPHFWMHGYFPE